MQLPRIFVTTLTDGSSVAEAARSANPSMSAEVARQALLDAMFKTHDDALAVVHTDVPESKSVMPHDGVFLEACDQDLRPSSR